MKLSFGDKIGEGFVQLTHNELVLPFGLLTSVPILMKIDQEMRPRECPQTRKPIL